MANREKGDVSSTCCPACAQYFITTVFGDHYDETFLEPDGRKAVLRVNFFQDILTYVKVRVKCALINLGYYEVDEVSSTNAVMEQKISEVYESVRKDLHEYLATSREKMLKKIMFHNMDCMLEANKIIILLMLGHSFDQSPQHV